MHGAASADEAPALRRGLSWCGVRYLVGSASPYGGVGWLPEDRNTDFMDRRVDVVAGAWDGLSARRQGTMLADAAARDDGPK
jgi:hypothetical protein